MRVSQILDGQYTTMATVSFATLFHYNFFRWLTCMHIIIGWMEGSSSILIFYLDSPLPNEYFIVGLLRRLTVEQRDRLGYEPIKLSKLLGRMQFPSVSCFSSSVEQKKSGSEILIYVSLKPS